MKVNRIITSIFVVTLLICLFTLGAFALEEVSDVNWEYYKNEYMVENDQLQNIGDRVYEEVEPNNTIAQANSILMNTTVDGTLAWYDADIYEINVPEYSTFMIYAGCYTGSLTFQLYDSNGTYLTGPLYTDYDPEYSYYSDGVAVEAPAGKYYVKVYDPNAYYYSQYYYTPIDYILYAGPIVEEDEDTYKIGDNVYYSIYDGVLTMYGTGETYDFDFSPWDKTVVETAIIEEGITRIGHRCFKDNKNLNELILPSTLKEIGKQAFSGCTKLNPVEFPDNDVILENFAFSGCVEFDTIDLTGVYSVGESAFDISSNIKSVTGSGYLDYIGWSAFGGHGNLYKFEYFGDIGTVGECFFANDWVFNSFVVHGSIDTIGPRAFWDCRALKNVVIEGGVKHIQGGAFYNCPIPNVDFIQDVETIGNSFRYCKKITTAVMNNRIPTLYEEAFSNCYALESVYLYGGVDTIEKNVFLNCSALDTVVLAGDAPVIHNTAFTGVTATVYYPADNTTYTEDMMLDYGGDLTWVAHTHNYEETVITEAFDTTDGEILYHCPDCGHEYTVIVPAPNPFDDVILGKFYYDPVMWALENNITKGITDSTFEPDTGCSRGQVVTFLWRAAGCPEPTSTEHNFTDVRKGAYYYKAMLWAVEQGITVGTTKTTFAPDDTCTRGQVVTFLWRAAGSPAAENREHSFTDVRENGYYFKAMLWAVENGITKGTTRTEFAPDDTCNRGQVVTFLYRQYA